MTNLQAAHNLCTQTNKHPLGIYFYLKVMRILQPREIPLREHFSSGILLPQRQMSTSQSFSMHALYPATAESHQRAERSYTFSTMSYFSNSHSCSLKRLSKHTKLPVTTCLLTSMQRNSAVSKSGPWPFSQSNFLLRFLTKRKPVAFLQVNSLLRLEVGFVCKDCPMQIRADEHLTNLFTDQSCWAGLSDFLSKQRTTLYGHLVVPELVV